MLLGCWGAAWVSISSSFKGVLERTLHDSTHGCFPKAWCAIGILNPTMFPTQPCRAVTVGDAPRRCRTDPFAHGVTGTGHGRLQPVSSSVKRRVHRVEGMDVLVYNDQKSRATSQGQEASPALGIRPYTPSSSLLTRRHQGPRLGPRQPQGHHQQNWAKHGPTDGLPQTPRPPYGHHLPAPAWQTPAQVTSSKKPPRGSGGGQLQVDHSFQAVNCPVRLLGPVTGRDPKGAAVITVNKDTSAKPFLEPLSRSAGPPSAHTSDTHPTFCPAHPRASVPCL